MTWYMGNNDYLGALSPDSGNQAPLYNEARNFQRGQDFYQPIQSAYKPLRRQNRITDVMGLYNPQKRSAKMNNQGIYNPQAFNPQVISPFAGGTMPAEDLSYQQIMPYNQPGLLGGQVNPMQATPAAPATPVQQAPSNGGVRYFTSGGVGDNAIGQYQIPSMNNTNFGKKFAETGTFGTKGLKAIQNMGYADEAAYLAKNPNLAKAGAAAAAQTNVVKTNAGQGITSRGNAPATLSNNKKKR